MFRDLWFALIKTLCRPQDDFAWFNVESIQLENKQNNLCFLLVVGASIET